MADISEALETLRSVIGLREIASLIERTGVSLDVQLPAKFLLSF